MLNKPDDVVSDRHEPCPPRLDVRCHQGCSEPIRFYEGPHGEGLLAENQCLHAQSLFDETVAAIRDAKRLPAAEASGEVVKKSESAAEAVKESASIRLVQLALDAGLELWHDPDLETYATFAPNGITQHATIHGSAFEYWLRWLAFRQSPRWTPGTQTLQGALDDLSAQAVYEGSEHRVFTRIAHVSGKIIIDLGNSDWDVVTVSARGWSIGNAPSDVYFRRSRGMLPLPRPESGGSLDELRPFLNVANADAWRLLVGFLIGCFSPGPFPALVLTGPQGAAKSTAARVIRELIDPNSAPLRFLPKELRDLAISGRNCWLQVFDNLGGLPDWISNALCTFSTGGGFATRKNYTDAEEEIFNFKRPIILTGIADPVSRPDLLDRSLVLELAGIPENKRKSEKKLEAEFQRIKPRIFGALMDVLPSVLKNLPNIKLDTLPRMADFAMWVTAAEVSLGWKSGSFLESYSLNRKESCRIGIEASPVGEALMEIFGEGRFNDRISRLFEMLLGRVDESSRHVPGWPKNVQSLSRQLKGLAPSIEAEGYTITFYRQKDGAYVYVDRNSINEEKFRENASFPSSRHPHAQNDLFGVTQSGNAVTQSGNAVTHSSDGMTQSDGSGKAIHAQNDAMTEMTHFSPNFPIPAGPDADRDLDSLLAAAPTEDEEAK